MPSQAQGNYLTRKVLLPGGGPSLIRSLDRSQSREAVPQIFRDAMDIRLRVFCDEQDCSVANELDLDDERSWHWVAYEFSSPSSTPPPLLAPSSCSPPPPSTSGADGRAIACLRLVPPPHAPHPNGFEDPAEKPYLKLGRMAVVPEARGRGLARSLCEDALGWAVQNARRIGEGWEGLVLVHAQTRVEGAWERLGFKADARLGRWEEEGIEHLGMWRQLDMKGGSPGFDETPRRDVDE